jgi:predicted GNAT superfamily acetyltransferase
VITYRDLTTLDEFAAVVNLEREIWGPGYDDPVPVPILAVTVRRGGILIGAFDGPSTDSGPSRAESKDGERLIGFVYSHPGIKAGRPTQWSHMLGVIDRFRNDGIGYRLKLLQRERTIAMGVDLVEWTYDPMQAMNAHLNFAKLGVVVEEYEENVYGASNSPLHRGNPTDRFVAEWHVGAPHVERRLNRAGALTVRTDELADAPRANQSVARGEWQECADVNLNLETRRLLVQIPMGFTDMLGQAPELALDWRMKTREIFQTYFAGHYRAVDFLLDRASRSGSYLLVRDR